MVRQTHMFVSNLPNLSRLPKIKAWIDTNNPGDPLIPFSVSLEERLSALSDEEKVAAQKEGAQSALGKITQAGYASLDVCDPLGSHPYTILTTCIFSLSGTLPAGLMKLGHGRSDGVQRHHRLLVSFSTFSTPILPFVTDRDFIQLGL